jgi:hypothetical protein
LVQGASRTQGFRHHRGRACKRQVLLLRRAAAWWFFPRANPRNLVKDDEVVAGEHARCIKQCLHKLTDFRAETYEIADDEARGEQVKQIVQSCVGRLRCQWAVVRCKNSLPGASAAIAVQTCAFDTEVCLCILPWLLRCGLQAVITTIKSLIAPSEFAFLQWFNDPPPIEADVTGQIVSTEEGEPDTGLAL